MFWVLLIAIFLHFIGFSVWISFIFEYTFKYLYTGFNATEIYLKDKFLIHRYLLMVITAYAVYVSRIPLLSAWYECAMHSENHQFKLRKKSELYFKRLIFGISFWLFLTWLMGYWMLFQVPVFFTNCSGNARLLTCMNISENFFFFRFIFRYLFWWGGFIFFLWMLSFMIYADRSKHKDINGNIRNIENLSDYYKFKSRFFKTID
ncbi:hypothetical protein [Stenoxybacter acetivorans]|uniref:hypothetical protein n=1 Tax=Stenoxybacter acetivorans TaxID=422441 RepID=UPI0005632241|nr:hypothetical protein [Stenoxybacter acetivorans]